MTLLVTHLLALAVGAVLGGVYASLKVRERETAAELRGMLANVIAHSPLDERYRKAEGVS